MYFFAPLILVPTLFQTPEKRKKHPDPRHETIVNSITMKLPLLITFTQIIFYITTVFEDVIHICPNLHIRHQKPERVLTVRGTISCHVLGLKC